MSRPLFSWAKNSDLDNFTVRHGVVYGDDPLHGPVNPIQTNHLGQPYKNYDESGLDNHFDELSKEYFALYTFLEEQEEVHFQLTANQKLKFNQFFSEIQSKYLGLMGNDYMATVRRLGLIAFRISMIFSVLRIIDSKTYKKELLCNDADFENAIELVKVLIQHSSKVFAELPDERLSSDRSTRKTKFFEALPAEFNRQGYLEVARSLSIPDRTVERYVTDLCNSGLITRLKQDCYELTKT